MADYAEALHPRGPDGKWIVKGSAGAVTAARAAVKAAVAGRKSPDEMRLLAAHLKLLTAPQLRALAAETGLSGGARASGPPAGGKFAGAPVGKAEHVHAALVEHEVAAHLGGAQLEDNEPLDVRVPRAGGGEDAVEVKSLLKGEKQSLSVHPDALLRKVDYARSTPGAVYHTVAVDERATYGGGEFEGNYSGNRLYYKRGSGRFALNSMHSVKDAAELRSLVAAKDSELPAAARGGLPKGEAAVRLRAAATKAHAARLAKDRARKARLKGGG